MPTVPIRRFVIIVLAVAVIILAVGLAFPKLRPWLWLELLPPPF